MAGSRQVQEPHGPGHALERMIFFSDAVFAIAITLLIIEIHVPELEHRSDHDFLLALAQLGPHFLSFFISFFVIGAFWSGHHRAFDCARHWDQKLFLPNLVMLSTIAAMPFFTAFSSQYFGYRVPIALYCAWMSLTALANIWLQRIATSPPVVGEHVSQAQRDAIRQRGVAVLLGSLTALAVCLIYPFLGQIGLLSIFLWRRLVPRFWKSR